MKYKYGGKIVVGDMEPKEGYILEPVNGELVVRKYYKTKYGAYIRDYREEYHIDIFKVMKAKTPLGKVRKISQQLGDGDYYISENAVGVLQDL